MSKVEKSAEDAEEVKKIEKDADIEEDDDVDENEEGNEEGNAEGKKCRSYKVNEFRNLNIFSRLTKAFIGKRGRLTNFFKYVAKMDTNGDGVISLEEFSSCLLKVFKKQVDCPSLEEIEDIYNLIDHDGEGKVPIGEFLNILRGPMSQDRLMYINMAFDKLDESQDGFIDAKEALSYFHQKKEDDELESSKQEARKFIEEFDSTEIDGRVSWQEFHEFYWNISITCNEDEMFRQKIINTWSLTKEDISNYAELWIVQDVFPQKFPLYSSGASAVCGVRIPPELLGRSSIPTEEVDGVENTLSRPKNGKPSFESPRTAVVSIVKGANEQTLKEENTALKNQLAELKAQLKESKSCAEKLVAILSK